MTDLAIIGAGGLGREVHEVVEAVVRAGLEDIRVLGFLDDGQPDTDLLHGRGQSHLGPVERLGEMPTGVRFVIAVGSSAVRARIARAAARTGREALTLVHPSAVLGRHHVRVGAGSIVCATAAITTDVHIGDHVVVDQGVTIGHDVYVDDFATLHPNATISGNVRLGARCTMGAASCVLPGVSVGEDSVVGAGAVVVRDLPPGVVATGVPARVRSSHAAAYDDR